MGRRPLRDSPFLSAADRYTVQRTDESQKARSDTMHMQNCMFFYSCTKGGDTKPATLQVLPCSQHHDTRPCLPFDCLDAVPRHRSAAQSLAPQPVSLASHLQPPSHPSV